MKKEKYEKLSKLERVIYDYLFTAFNANQYTIELEDSAFASDGYLTVIVTICEMKLRCAVNEKNYICWYCGEPFGRLLEEVPHFVRKICAQTKRILKENEEEYRKQRIKQLQKELDNLIKA